MLRATKVRLYPTPEQAKFLLAQFDAVRFVYNKALYLKSRTFQKHGIKGGKTYRYSLWKLAEDEALLPRSGL